MKCAIAIGILASVGSAALFVADDRQPPPAPSPFEIDEGLQTKKVARGGDPTGAPVASPEKRGIKERIPQQKAADGIEEAIKANKANDDIEAALERPTFADFSETPLTQALQFLAVQGKIRMHLDATGLADAMVDREQSVTFQMAGVRLGLVLDLILEPLNLDYCIRENVLFISSRERIENLRETVVVRIGELIGPDADPQEIADRLVKLITENIDHDQWMANGGANMIQFVEDARSLVVTSNGKTQRRISKLLSDLKTAKLAKGMPDRKDATAKIAAK